MKITGITVIPLDYRSSAKPGEAAATVLVKLSSGPEISGVAVAHADLSASITRLGGELLLGEDPRSVAAHWQRMTTTSASDSNPGMRTRSAAALDIALWDLKANANGEPLWKTLGGCRPRVNTHLAGCRSDADDAEVSQWVDLQSARYGFYAAKIPASADVQATSRRLALASSALRQHTHSSAPPTLMLDADCRWTAAEAIRHIRALERNIDLTWVESPVIHNDFLGMTQISNGISAAVCAGRHFVTAQDARAFLHHRSLDILQIDTAKCGFTGAMQLADAAFGFELPVALCDSPGNINAHLGSALPYCMSMEVSCASGTDTATSDVRIEDGWAIAGDRPGHGLTFRETETSRPVTARAEHS